MRSSPFMVLLFCAAAQAQFGEPGTPHSFAEAARVQTSITPQAAKPGEVVKLKLAIELKPFCHTYPTAPPQQSNNKIFTPAGPFIDVGRPLDPEGFLVQPGNTLRYYEDKVTWEWEAVVSPRAAPGKVKVEFESTRLIACIEIPQESCFPAKSSNIPGVEFEVLPGPAAPVPGKYLAMVEKALGGMVPTVVSSPSPSAELARNATVPAAEKASPHAGLIRKKAKPLAEYKADLDAIAASLVKDKDVTATAVGSGLLGLLSAAIFWGYVSLVTPCVFPMIPITVSLFLKKSQQSTGGAVKYALVYCLTIIAVLGLSAFALLDFFRALSVSPVMNIFLGGLFIVFALSLFGMYDIQLPGFLLRATEKRRAAGGLAGTVFGALAFSIVSFTCVAPFLGGFAGIAASGNYCQIELVLAGLAFATAFASPFFVLAMFPSLLKKMPRSGGWLDSVKAVMGFLELAAAFKFFRTAELRYPPVEFFTYDVVLGAWVVIAIACGFYLLGFFRLPHDEEKQNLGVPRMLFALMFLGLGVHLMPGLFKTGDGKAERPKGIVFAWVEAFLLPEVSDDLPWSFDLTAALAEARQEKKLVFVDFTGVNCTNCRYNENSVFTIPEIREAMSKYQLVELYTDDMPLEAYGSPPDAASRKREADANGEFQWEGFGKTQQLPLYAILKPVENGQVQIVGIYRESKINDKDAFLKFLTRQ